MAHKSDLYARWSSEIRRSNVFRAGERVGVAVSGGPDSVLLLDFMRGLAAELGLTLSVVHFNHRLRGPESDADEKFVRDLASDSGLPFHSGQANVGRLARERRQNLEAAARDLRYRFFFALASSGQLDKVATAHTSNDQAETVLLRILRGTGTRGLGGIFPSLQEKVVRPFLGLTRAEIEQEIRERKLSYRVDSSNLDRRLTRNKIRLELLPWLEQEFNPRVISLLKELAERARADEAVLEKQAWERALAWRVREGSMEKIPVRRLLEFPPAIGRRVLRQMVFDAQKSLRGITHQHIETLLHFSSEGQSGRVLCMPNGLMACKDFDWLQIGPQLTHWAGYCFPVTVPGEVFVPALGVTFQFKIIGSEEYRKAYNGFEMAGIDPLKLPKSLKLRNWRDGDHFRPLGSRKLRKLKELFVQQRIPSYHRKVWPVLESESQILWVRGFPPALPVAASPEASEILVVVEGNPKSR